MPVRPFGRAIEETGVPGGNRPVVQEAAQVRRQRGGRLVALTRLGAAAVCTMVSRSRGIVGSSLPNRVGPSSVTRRISGRGQTL